MIFLLYLRNKSRKQTFQYRAYFREYFYKPTFHFLTKDGTSDGQSANFSYK